MENQTVQQPTIEPQMPVQPAPQPVSEPKPELKNPFLKWSFIVGLILIFALIGGGYFLGQKSILKNPPVAKISPTSVPTSTPTPTPDPTAGWKTYSHPLLPISFKYPSDKLTPTFNNVDPNNAIKIVKAQALEMGMGTDIDGYANSRCHKDGLGNLAQTDLGSLFPAATFIPNHAYRYRGIRLTEYYLGNQDISVLATCHQEEKGSFSTMELNGAKVEVFDGTSQTSGIPPANIKTYYFKMGPYVLSVDTFIFASATADEKTTVFNILDNIAKTMKIGESSALPIPTDAPTSTPTPIPFKIDNINPGYIPMNYSSLGKNHLTVNGFQFKREATVKLEGPYDLQTNQALNGQAISQYTLTNVVFTPSERYDGTIPDGLPNGYFKVIVVNPDGSSASTGLSLLRGGDPNEK